MKTKYLLTLLVAFGCFSTQAQQEEVPAQEEVPNENFYENRDWAAIIQKSHDFWGQGTCMAYTMADDGLSRLEVMALAEGDGFTEPTVQIVSPMSDVFFEVKVETIGKSSTFSLLPLFSSQTGSNLVAAVVGVEEREALIRAITAKSRLIAKYVDTQGVVREVSFSLMGSSATLRETFNHCGLSFNEETMVFLD